MRARRAPNVVLERAACFGMDSVASARHLDGAQTLKVQGRRWCADAYFPRVFLDFLVVVLLAMTSLLHRDPIPAVAFQSVKHDRLVPRALVPHLTRRIFDKIAPLEVQASFRMQKLF